MKMCLSLIVGCYLGVSWASGEGEVPECPGLSQEHRTQLEALTVKDDIHDKLVGNFSELWGQKAILDEDEDICVKYSRVKVDDTHLSQVWHFSDSGNNTKVKVENVNLEKVGNGIYVLRDSTGTANVKYYILYANEHVTAQFGCYLHDVSGLSLPPGVSAVSVHSQDVKTPLETQVQTQVDEAVKILQDHKDVVGEIALYAHVC